MTRWAHLLLDTLALLCLAPTADAASGRLAHWPSAGSMWYVETYEAESATFGGNARAISAADGSDRQVGDLAGEASGRQAVTLMNAGDSVRSKSRRRLPARMPSSFATQFRMLPTGAGSAKSWI